MDEVRWFASNAYTALVVSWLREHGLVVATDGDRPARVALAMSGLAAEEAWRFSRRHGARFIVYLWDLPPVGTGWGRADPVWWVGGRFLRLPRPWGGYRRRRGYYSRLRYISARADAVWGASTLTCDTIAERFGVRAERLPYCYDSNRFRPRPPDAPRADPPILLTVSRLRQHKNQAAVLEAAARLGQPVRVRLIGRGEEAGALAALARRLNVTCTVETSADDATVDRAYHEATVAVCPSRFEGFGLTPIEAVASGVPTVASDIPPHREFAGPAVRLVPVDDVPALATAIGAALNAPPADPALIADLTIPAAGARLLSALRPFLG
ncbi:MAG TPA: glycosyltransferase [Gemmatimonadales bacterium]|nr:glycosyltransferase [Gemmatimonadales bacterium]